MFFNLIGFLRSFLHKPNYFYTVFFIENFVIYNSLPRAPEAFNFWETCKFQKRKCQLICYSFKVHVRSLLKNQNKKFEFVKK